MAAQRIAYMMSRFPNLTETFILREISALVASGWQVAVYPLIHQRQPVVHPEAVALDSRVRQMSFMSFGIAAENARMAFVRPRPYFATLAIALWSNLRSPKFLLRCIALWPKAVYAARLMDREGIGHLHAHYATHPALAAWIIRRLTGISYSVTIHSHDLYANRTMIDRKLRDAAFVVTISEYNRARLRDDVGHWADDKTVLVRCGVPRAATRMLARPRATGERLEWVSIGSLEEHKGFDVLLDACERLRARRVDFRCRVVGVGRLRRLLERQIVVRRLQDHVTLVGACTQQQVETILSSAHCYTQQSRWTRSGKGEGLPVALMEAMAAGLPVIATAISGIPELVRDGETGWLIPPDDAETLANAIHHVARDPAEAQARATRGRELVCREYDLEHNVAALAECFRRLLAARDAR